MVFANTITEIETMRKESKAIPKSLLMRRLRASRKAAGLISWRADVTPDEARKLQICLDRLRKVKA